MNESELFRFAYIYTREVCLLKIYYAHAHILAHTTHIVREPL